MHATFLGLQLLVLASIYITSYRMHRNQPVHAPVSAAQGLFVASHKFGTFKSFNHLSGAGFYSSSQKAKRFSQI